MTTINLNELGITHDDLIDRMVTRLCENLLDEDGERSSFAIEVQDRVRAQIDAAVSKIAEEHVLPQVEKLVAETTFQKSNKWGEPKSPVMTFREYLEETAKTWMEEPVNNQGTSKKDGTYGWSASGTRLAHMIHQHLDYHIKGVVETALKDANAMFAKGLYEVCKMKINEVAAQFKVTVSTGRN